MGRITDSPLQRGLCRGVSLTRPAAKMTSPRLGSDVSRALACRGRTCLLVRPLARLDRQQNVERAARQQLFVVAGTVDPDAPAVSVNRAARNCQSQARP